MHKIRLIATDLDGTIVGGMDEFHRYPEFREKLDKIRRENGAYWVVCTGRSVRSFKNSFASMRLLDIIPDFIIVRHDQIYEWTKMGYIPHLFWNIKISFQLRIAELINRSLIDEWHEVLAGLSNDVTTLDKKKNHLWLKFTSESSADAAVAILEKNEHKLRRFQIFRRPTEVELRAIPFTKGMALIELSKHLGISPGETIAIGNGHNDISMLNIMVAEKTGCPSNSEYEVMQAVNKAKGHISRFKALSGVIDVMDAYTAGKIDSTIPESADLLEAARSRSVRWTSKRHKQWKGMKHALLLGCGVYVILLVLSYYNLVPFISRFIRLPFDLLVKLISGL